MKSAALLQQKLFFKRVCKGRHALKQHVQACKSGKKRTKYLALVPSAIDQDVAKVCFVLTEQR